MLTGLCGGVSHRGRALISITRVPGGYNRTGPTRLTGRIRAHYPRVAGAFTIIESLGTWYPRNHATAGNWYSRFSIPIQYPYETLPNHTLADIADHTLYPQR